MAVTYNQAKLANEVKKKYPVKLGLFKQQKQDYKAIFRVAKVVAESEDFNEKRTAEFHKNLLQKQFQNLVQLGSEFLSLVPHVTTTAVTPYDRALVCYSEERLTVRQVLTKLEQVMNEVEEQDRKTLAQLSKPENVPMTAPGH